MIETPYEAESILQKLIADYPNLLAGEQMDAGSPRRWLLVRREMGVPSKEHGFPQWSLDHLFLDQDGIPTLVEVKRSSDTRIRREVVGQMLDYAANGVAYWPVQDIRATWEASRDSEAAERELSDLLQGAQAADELWEAVKTNLQAGKVRLVFVADVIPPELLRIVQFLSKQMDPAQVFALEVRQYSGKGQTTLVPRIVGQEIKPPVAPPGRQWDESSFFERLGATDPLGVPVARALHEWAKTEMPAIVWGRGSEYGTFTPGLWLDEIRYQFFRVYTSGGIEMQFGYLATRPPFNNPDPLKQLRRLLNEVPGVSLAEELKYPGLPLAALREKASLHGFLDVLSRTIREIKTS